MSDDATRKTADADITRQVEGWVRIRMALGAPVAPSTLADLHAAGLIGDTLRVAATHYAWTWTTRPEEA